MASRHGDRRRTESGWLPFAVGVFAIVALLLGSNLPNPLFPLYAKTFGLSPLEITLIFATYTLLVIPALILLAPLSDAKGRRLLFSASIVVAAVAAGLFAAAMSAAWLYAAQAVQALALGALQGTAAPALVESDPSGNVRRASATASAATLTGAALGPILAGLLAQYGPLSPRLPYLVEVVLLAFALAVVRLLPEPSTRRPWRARRPEISKKIRRRFAIAAVSAFVGWAVTGLYLALIPSFVTTVLHQNLAIAGLVMALMLAVSAASASRSHRLDSLRAQLVGVITMTISVVALLGATSSESLVFLLVATLVAGAGQGLTFMGSLADVTEVAPADRRANTVASYYVVVYLGTALPVIGVGALASPVGLVRAIEIFAIVVFTICLGGAVALTWELRRQRIGRQREVRDCA